MFLEVYGDIQGEKMKMQTDKNHLSLNKCYRTARAADVTRPASILFAIWAVFASRIENYNP